MTNVSKHTLSKKTQQKLFSQFTRLFSTAGERKCADMFDALFTDAEKIMFIKRVAIILLLSKGVSIYAIARSVHVSETTVRAVKENHDAGQYRSLLSMTRNESFDWSEFWDVAEVLLRLGMPSYGKDRWKWMK